MSTNMDLLAHIPAFLQLKPSLQQHLTQEATAQKYQPNDIIYHQGDSIEAFYAVVEGHVKLFRTAQERHQILALLHSGDCFGTEALSSTPFSSYSTAAVTPCTVLLIPAETMKQLLDMEPEFRIILLQLVTERLRQFADLVHNLAFRDVTARLATILVDRAESEGMTTPEGILIPRLMTQSELATMIGTGREVVQRTLKRFAADDILHITRKEILITDMERLHRIAEQEIR